MNIINDTMIENLCATFKRSVESTFETLDLAVVEFFELTGLQVVREVSIVKFRYFASCLKEQVDKLGISKPTLTNYLSKYKASRGIQMERAKGEGRGGSRFERIQIVLSDKWSDSAKSALIKLAEKKDGVVALLDEVRGSISAIEIEKAERAKAKPKAKAKTTAIATLGEVIDKAMQG